MLSVVFVFVLHVLCALGPGRLEAGAHSWSRVEERIQKIKTKTRDRRQEVLKSKLATRSLIQYSPV